MLIGITGLARCGKNSFSRFAQEYLQNKGFTTEEFAFADELKKDLEEFVVAKTGISIWTENTKEKNIIRPLMVEYGKIMRQLTNGRAWIEKLIPKLEASKADYKFVTDCRFSQFENDEADFIQSGGGKIIHITRFSVDKARRFRIPLEAINEEEAKNDPKMKERADLRFSWDDFEGDEETAKQKVWKFLKENL